MLKYDKEEVVTNLNNLFDSFPDWENPNGDTVKYYAESMESKNDFLQKMFDGTNGRIVLTEEEKEKYLENNALNTVYSYLNKFSGLRVSKSGVSFQKDVQTIIDNFVSNYYRAEERKEVFIVREYFCDLTENLRQAFVRYIDRITLDKEKNTVLPKEREFIGFGRGQKLTKVFNTILENMFSFYNPLELEDGYIIVEHILNRIKDVIIGGYIAGFLSTKKDTDVKLVLSIRPEDLFLISYGNSWRSCMHPDCGEYNNGVLGYMNGPDAFVAFIAKEDEVNAINFATQKIWRQMMFVSPERTDEGNYALLAQKGYPNNEPLLAEAFCLKALELLGWDKHQDENPSEVICKTTKDTYGYVDSLMVSDAIVEAYTQKELAPENGLHIVNLSGCQGDFMCFKCGLKNPAGDCNGNCEFCAGNFCCDYCEELGLEEEMFLVFDDEDTSFTVCENCAEAHYVYSEIKDMYLSNDNAVWVESEQDYFWANESTYVPSISGYALDTDIVFCEDLDEYYLEEDTVVSRDGNNIPIEDATYIEETDEYVLNNEAEWDSENNKWVLLTD